MKFSLPCATFARIAGASLLDAEQFPKYDDKWLRSVRLERRNGSEFIVATQRQILVVELTGQNDEAPDGFIHVVNDSRFLSEVNKAANLDGVLTIDANPGWTVATIDGAFYPENVGIDGMDLPKDWRLFFAVGEGTTTRGAFGFDAELLARVARTSPSGQIVFPKSIDATTFVILNDIIDPDWMGVLMNIDVETKLKPAIVRAWAK